jgi:Sen15 protein
LVSGLPPRRIYVHPDEQVELLKAKHYGKGDIVEHPELEWILPTHLTESWSLKKFSEIFDAIDTVPPVEGHAGTYDDHESVGQQWRGKRRQKRVLLATLHDDSTVVYYIMHDGIVKPRQNWLISTKFLEVGPKSREKLQTWAFLTSSVVLLTLKMTFWAFILSNMSYPLTASTKGITLSNINLSAVGHLVTTSKSNWLTQVGVAFLEEVEELAERLSGLGIYPFAISGFSHMLHYQSMESSHS